MYTYICIYLCILYIYVYMNTFTYKSCKYIDIYIATADVRSRGSSPADTAPCGAEGASAAGRDRSHDQSRSDQGPDCEGNLDMAVTLW